MQELQALYREIERLRKNGEPSQLKLEQKLLEFNSLATKRNNELSKESQKLFELQNKANRWQL